MQQHPLSAVAKAILAVSLSAALAVGCGGGSDSNENPAPVVSLDQVRSSTALDRNWRFVFDESLADEQALGANTANWSQVSLPHTWNATDAATTAQSTPSTATYQRGVGWYQL